MNYTNIKVSLMTFGLLSLILVTLAPIWVMLADLTKVVIGWIDDKRDCELNEDT